MSSDQKLGIYDVEGLGVKNYLFCLLVLVFLISGCSSPKEKPSDISQEIWDKSIQYAILADIAGYEKNIKAHELGLSFLNEFTKFENQSENEKKLIKSVDQMIVDKYLLIIKEQYGFMLDDEKEIYKNSRRVATEIIGESALD
jgi:hypothetical protein